MTQIARKLVKRDKYLKDALRFRDTDLIKVVTGVRRCGKSSLLALIEMQLRSEGVPDERLLQVNLESKQTPIASEDDTRNRELAPLRSIRDAFRKVIVVREGTYETDVDGIRIIPAREFFLPDRA